MPYREHRNHISVSQYARRRRDIERERRHRHRRSLSPSLDRLRESRSRLFDGHKSSDNLRNDQAPQTEDDIRKKKNDFFDAHKSEEWLRDWYHPLRETCIQVGKDMLEAAVSEVLDACFVEKLQSEKWGWKYKCKAPGCPKGFETLKFVLNHLKNKHHEIVQSVIAKLSEEVYIQHYINDPKGPYPQQRNDLQRLPLVVVPIEGAGRLGPFVAAPVEVTWGFLANVTVEIPREVANTRSRLRYDDLHPPTEDEITVTDYRCTNN